MPLLRSKMAAHRARSMFVGRFFATMAVVAILFILIVGVHYLLGWW